MRWKVTNVIHWWIDYTANSFGDTNKNIFLTWLSPLNKMVVVVVGDSGDVLLLFMPMVDGH